MSPEQWRAFLDSLEGEKGLPEEMQMFPIMHGKSVHEIPWTMIAKHEAQAVKNHQQTIERLAQRGGISAKEALYVIRGMPLFSEPALWEATLEQDERSLLLREREHLKEHYRRTVSRQTPDLKERVKELMRDAMAAQAQHQSGMGWTDANKLISEFRALCEPEVKP